MFTAFLYAALFLSGASGGDIPTSQFDTSRTSWNSSEIYLNSSNVNATGFGKLFTRTLDGWVYAQPLYLQNLSIPGSGSPNVIYVCTANNSVYAFDADNPAITNPYWSTNLGAPDTTPSTSTSPNSEPSLGIISTPTIVRASGTLYLTAATRESGHRVYRLHALDITTGREKPNSPVVITGQTVGAASDAQNGVLTFNPDFHLQRAGLAVAGGSVYITMAGSRDITPFHGWVFGYDLTTLTQTAVLNLTSNGMGAGVWQSMRAPVVDSAGSLYLETGNGDYDGATNFGNSVLRLGSTPSGFGVADWFTPDNWQYLTNNDLDLSSAGPLMVPGTTSLIAAGKNGTLYVLNTVSLGGLVSGNGQIVQTLQASGTCNAVSCNYTNDAIFWNSASGPMLYIWPWFDVLRGYAWSGGQLSTTPTSMNNLDSGYPGGFLSGSSNGSTPGTGIVWALTGDMENTEAGSLRAYDASNVSSQLWTSGMNAARDSAGLFTKNLRPVVANGKVYVGNFSSQLIVYGLLSGAGTGPVVMGLQGTASPSYGQPVTLTAAVSPPGATGTVWFTDGSTSLGSATLNAGSASLPGVSLTAGSHSLNAVYSGDSIYAGGSASLAEVVSKATPAINWPAPAAIAFGGALSSVQLDATSGVPGSFVYTPAAGTVLPAGNGQTLSAIFTPTDTGDYNSASSSTTINVNPATPPATPANLVVTKVLSRSGGSIVVQVTIANTGGAPAANATLTSVKVGAATGSPLPQSLGSIAGGASTVATVTVSGSVGASGASSTLAVTGTWTGGSFSSSARITLP